MIFNYIVQNRGMSYGLVLQHNCIVFECNAFIRLGAFFCTLCFEKSEKNVSNPIMAATYSRRSVCHTHWPMFEAWFEAAMLKVTCICVARKLHWLKTDSAQRVSMVSSSQQTTVQQKRVKQRPTAVWMCCKLVCWSMMPEKIATNSGRKRENRRINARFVLFHRCSHRASLYLACLCIWLCVSWNWDCSI